MVKSKSAEPTETGTASQPGKITKEQCLSAIDAKFHPLATELNLKGLDWSLVLMIVQTILTQIIDALKRQPVSASAKVSECDPAVKVAIEAAVSAAVENLCAALCVAHCSGCCPHE